MRDSDTTACLLSPLYSSVRSFAPIYCDIFQSFCLTCNCTCSFERTQYFIKCATFRWQQMQSHKQRQITKKKKPVAPQIEKQGNLLIRCFANHWKRTWCVIHSGNQRIATNSSGSDACSQFKMAKFLYNIYFYKTSQTKRKMGLDLLYCQVDKRNSRKWKHCAPDSCVPKTNRQKKKKTNLP